VAPGASSIKLMSKCKELKVKLILRDLHWLSGLLEGEGSFIFSGGSPRICVASVDLDVIKRAHTILSCTGNIHEDVTVSGKVIYKINLQGERAIGWMFTLYMLMGRRRQEKISEIITEWKNHTVLNSGKNHKKFITMIDGKKVCSLHGPVDTNNVLYVGKYTRCKGCYSRAS